MDKHTSSKNEYLNALRHSAEHVLEYAMCNLYPTLKMAVGPATSNGFYFDFDYESKISKEDLPKIEKEMQKIINEDLPVVRKEISIKKARELFKDNKYKQEWIDEIEKKGEKAVVYWIGKKFVDLCNGPHVKSTGEIKAFKLLSISGAYWRGSEKNKMLTRIYGTAFPTKEELDKYLRNIEEAKRRDHRKLGSELELFIFDDEVGPGLPLWLPKGAWLRKEIVDFAFETYLKNNYLPVSTPHIASEKLWQHSGHVEFYRDNLYGEFNVEGEKYRLKPMNCPFHVAIYKSKIRSYRDLPLRFTEMGTVYRYERSGVLHGLTRVRGFTQDDAHIICTPNQVSSEIEKAFDLTLYILGTFGFKDFEVNLSIRDPKNKDKFIGSDKDWERAELALKEVIEKKGFGGRYIEDVGGAVFYGPKIDLKIADSLGRKWQLSTIQFDFNLPRRFEMKYVGHDGKEHTPYMVHRALLGSVERFIGILIEHFAGAFPLWLAPIQVGIIPVSEKSSNYAQEILGILNKENIRTKLDNSKNTLSYKIRHAELQKIPYILVVGEKEVSSHTVNFRKRGEKKQKKTKLDIFIKLVKDKISRKSLIV